MAGRTVFATICHAPSPDGPRILTPAGRDGDGSVGIRRRAAPPNQGSETA